MSTDVTVEDELRAALSLLEATLDATDDGILVVDTDGRITSMNRRFAEMWRIPDQVLSQRDDQKALRFVVDQLVSPEAFLAKVREVYAQPEAESYDTLFFRDGRVYERVSRPQRVSGEVVGRVWSFRDVTERRRLEEELAHQAFHDSLTGLANQALFRDRVDHALARAERHCVDDPGAVEVAVLFIDLDNFKTVNDSLGHPVGDRLLVTMSERIRSCLRATDTAARLGGDEFAVLLEDLRDEREALEVAEKLVGSLSGQVPLGLDLRSGDNELFVSASVGVAFAEPGIRCDQLLRNADLAMYTAKGRGKGRWEIFESDMHTTAVERLEVETLLRRAGERGELVVQYQPVYELRTGRLAGMEALVRWWHPTRGLLQPDSFVPFAEEAGMIDQVDAHVLAVACAQARRWQVCLGDNRLSMAVNVAARELVEPGLVERVATALADSGLPPGSLVLEITERAMLRDVERAITCLHSLKRLGVRLAIDDFGTGYSSLSYLQRFPVDIVKIDRSFVERIDAEGGPARLTHAIIRLADTLGFRTVAEGIERASQRSTLRVMGCTQGQGYLLGRPQEAAQIDEWLRRPTDAALTPAYPAAG